MKTVVFSPHTDDAIFSLGSYLSTTQSSDIVIASPFAAIPEDEAGRLKHETLRAEHEHACAALGDVQIVNGPFLDDVYQPSDPTEVMRWLREQAIDADEIYVPLGIHHPDHVQTSDLIIKALTSGLAPTASITFYEELPYRVLYPELTQARLETIRSHFGHLKYEGRRSWDLKGRLVRLYKSQTDDNLVPMLMVTEHLWRVAR